MINYGGIPASTWDVNNFYPATYYREILSRIFSYAGYSWDSTFLDSAYFKRLTIPYSGDRLTISSTQATNRLFSATISSQSSGTVSFTVDPVVFDTESLDPSNQYDTSTGYFTVANSGYYDFYVSGTSVIDAVTSVTAIAAQAYFFTAVVVTRGASTFTYPVGSSALLFPSNGTYTSGQVISTHTWGNWTQTIQLYTGDTVRVQFNINLLNPLGSGTAAGVLRSGARFMNRITNTTVVDGGTLDYSAVMPTDVRCADFLSDTLKLFNLYVEKDSSIATKLKIDTYDSFYGTGSTRTWDDKLDVSQEVDIKPMGALSARRYVFKWADDSDYWNKYYLGKYGETFGMKYIDIQNDFLKNVETLEVMFAGTPSIGSAGLDRIIPEIYQESNSGVQTPIKSKLRILYWGGALSTSSSWTYTSQVSGSTTETTYPYAGHVDNPITPTYDVNIGVPREIYYVNPYGTTQYTDDNIYNRYHRRHYDEITDKNSKILVAFFYLKPLDIYNLSFRDRIFLLGHYWRINKVIDYNPTQEGVTKVELLKLKTGVSYVRTLKDLTLTQGETIGRDDAPAGGGNWSRGDTGNMSMNSNIGTNNVIDSTSRGVTVSGDSNRVGANCRYVNIEASSGVVVMDGLSNISVINTNNITITRNGETWIGGKRIDTSNNVYSITTSQTIQGNGTYECNGTLTLTLSASLLNTYEIIQVYNLGTGTVTIGGGGLNIRSSGGVSAATFVTSQQYDSITLEYKGSYYIVR
jgi:hypothetical protein